MLIYNWFIYFSYVALYPYKPQKADELELKRGAVYTVTERCQDGWFKGTSNRNQKCGVFPGNYVAPAKLVTIFVYFFCVSLRFTNIFMLPLCIHYTIPLK
jgi:hypothetical protein